MITYVKIVSVKFMIIRFVFYFPTFLYENGDKWNDRLVRGASKPYKDNNVYIM